MAQNLTCRQARWSLWLSHFEFTLTHKPGKMNTQADPLSHLSEFQVTDSEDNQGQVMLQPERFAQIASAAFQVHTPLEEKIRNISVKEAIVLEGLRALRQQGSSRLANGLPEWEEEDSLVYFQGKLYVLLVKELRNEVIMQCYDILTAKHPGKHGTLELVSHHYWWLSVR